MLGTTAQGSVGICLEREAGCNGNYLTMQGDAVAEATGMAATAAAWARQHSAQVH